MAPRSRSSLPPKDITDGIHTSDSEQSTTEHSTKKISKNKKLASLDKSSDEYRRRRERNNLAVKKSRTKSKMKTQQTLEQVNRLKAENEMLEVKIKTLTKELSFLKDLFLTHAGSAHGQQLTERDLRSLLQDSERATGGKLNGIKIERPEDGEISVEV